MTYTITELSLSNKNLENEKSSLLTALQLIQNDYNQSSIKSNTTEKPWNIVNNHKPNQIQFKSSHNSTTYMPVVKPPINQNVINCSSVNRYEILSDSDLEASAENEEPILAHDEPTTRQEKVNTNKSATKKPIASKKTRKIASPSNVPDNSASAKQCQASSEPSATPVRSTKAKRNTVIVGDSIIKYVKGWELSNASERVTVKSFSGATVDDMKDFIKPILRKKPEKLILHIGTNDLRSTVDLKVVADKVSNLVQTIYQQCPDIKVIVSGILTRKDVNGIADRVRQTNSLIESSCCENGWVFIENSNIKDSQLNSRGLHLNPSGSLLLQNNFKLLLRN